MLCGSPVWIAGNAGTLDIGARATVRPLVRPRSRLRVAQQAPISVAYSTQVVGLKEAHVTGVRQQCMEYQVSWCLQSLEGT